MGHVAAQRIRDFFRGDTTWDGGTIKRKLGDYLAFYTGNLAVVAFARNAKTTRKAGGAE